MAPRRMLFTKFLVPADRSEDDHANIHDANFDLVTVTEPARRRPGRRPTSPSCNLAMTSVGCHSGGCFPHTRLPNQQIVSQIHTRARSPLLSPRSCFPRSQLRARLVVFQHVLGLQLGRSNTLAFIGGVFLSRILRGDFPIRVSTGPPRSLYALSTARASFAPTPQQVSMTVYSSGSSRSGLRR